MTYSLDLDADRQALDVFTDIDALVPIILDGNPNGVKSAAYVGMRAYDQLSGTEYKCTATDQTIGGTTWEVVINTIVDATTTQKGVVEFATPEETTDGVDNTKAITPFCIAGVFATVADLQTEINDRTSAINATNSTVSGHTTQLNNATSAATSSVLMKRDASGRAQVVAGSASSDIVNKGQMDTADSTLQSQITVNSLDLATASSSAGANLLLRRDANGRAQVVAGSASGDIVIKSQLDAVASDATSAKTITDAATSSLTNSTVVKRDSNGRAKIADGSAIDDIASKGQVDTVSSSVTSLSALVAKMLGSNTIESLTLNGSNSATPTKAWVKLDTNGGAGTQNCDTIATTNSINFVLVQLTNSSHVVTLKHGTGNIQNKDGKDIVFVDTTQSVLYSLVGANYVEVARFGFEALTVVSSSAASFTANYNTLNKIDSTSGNKDFTLPTAVGYAGAVILVVKEVSANTINILYTSAQNANGSTGQTLTTAYSGYYFISDGANWRVFAIAPTSGGGAGYNRTVVAGGAFNINAGDNGYVVTAAGTGTLPAMGSSANSRITIVVTGNFDVTISRNSAQIQGTTNDLLLNGPCSIVLIEDGTSWWYVGGRNG